MTNIIEYRCSIPDSDSFFLLYQSTDWDAARQAEELYRAITNSWYVVSAYSEKALIGFGRIISDGILHAFIVDLIILPDFQSKGIGKEILERLVRKAIDIGITDIQLFCAEGKKGFYLKNGFAERSGNAPGMQYQI